VKEMEYQNVCLCACGMNPLYCNKDEKECQRLFDEEIELAKVDKLLSTF
jgi:hypothetical protein